MPERRPLIEALQQSLGGDARVVETHISWVLLAGDYAYKIKKPVDFGFLDFSTLDLRHHYCLEELRLNRRLAPDLYLGVSAVTGTPEAPGFDGPGRVLEYAVKLQRFDEACLADRLLGEGRLTAGLLDGLARVLAAFHGAAARATDLDGHGLPEAILAAAEHNFEHLSRIGPRPGEQGKKARLDALLAWTRAEFQRLREVFLARKASGFVRECHGDLHCGNLVLAGGRLLPFDCIEFSEDLRWIDCFSEVAFLLMDIEVRGRGDLAWRWLNHYLEITGDYAGLAVLDFYRVYRALVRAKIAGLSLGQADHAGGRLALEARCLRYIEYAERVARSARKRNPVLLITHGFSGSGKSRLAYSLAERWPAIRVASDIERKRLAGLAPLERSGSALSGGIYTEDMSRQTYALLLGHAEFLLRAGFNVLLDATYLRAADRDACRALAERLAVRFFILDLNAHEALLRERLAQRLARGGDPSEADSGVLARQMAEAEDLQRREKPFVLSLDAGFGANLDEVLRALGKADGGLRVPPI